MVDSSRVDNKRITKNAAILYVRMLLTMFVSLYASRVILEVLGVEDFGIYNVVWGVTSVVTFFQGSLMNVAQRYLNLGIGKGDVRLTNSYFNQFLLIFAVLSLLVFIIGETLSVWVVEHLLSIPVERLSAAYCVYQFSLLSLTLALIQIPYQAAVIANEKMGAFAYVTLFESFARLGILFVVQSFRGDYLIWYAFLLFVISVSVFAYYAGFCYLHFEECKLRYYFSRSLAKKTASFVGYNVYGCFAFSLCQQGVNVLLNVFFGPAVNAARAISMQVYQGIYKFSDNILVAVRPPIIKLYAQDDKERMISMSVNTTRYCLYINTLLVLPIMFNSEFILRLWLKQVPDFTAVFINIILIESFFNIMNQMITILVNATGDLKRNQFYGRTYTLLVLPLSYVMLLIVTSPVIPIAMIVVGTVLYFLNNLYDVHLQLQVSVVRYFKQVVVPIAVLNFILCMMFYAMSIWFGQGWSLLFSVCVCNVVFGCPLVFFLFLNRRERNLIVSKIHSVIQ